MNKFITLVVDGKVILRQRTLPFFYLFSVKVAEWDLQDYSTSEAMLLAERKMDEIERAGATA